MNRIAVIVILLGALIGSALLFYPQQQDTTKAQLINNDKPQGGDFTLINVEGEMKLSDFSDKLVLLYFGYTYCPDICPTNLGNLSVAYRHLTPEQKANTQIIFVSVDPERDTPKRLQDYASYFDADIIGLTGDAATLSEIASRYGVVYAKVDDPNNGSNYAVDHSAFTYVVAPGGQLMTQLPHATSPDQFIDVVKQYTTP